MIFTQLLVKGRVGVNTIFPEHSLEVGGNVAVNGLLYIKEEQSSTPTSPGQNNGAYLYTKADGKLYVKSHEVDGAIAMASDIPNVSNFISLTDLSTATNSASAGGALSYDNSTGVFTLLLLQYLMFLILYL